MSKCPNCGYDLERCDKCGGAAVISVCWSDRGPVFYCRAHIDGVWRAYFGDHSYDQIDLEVKWVDGEWHMFLEYDLGWKRDGTCEYIKFKAPNRLERCINQPTTTFEDSRGRIVICAAHMGETAR